MTALQEFYGFKTQPFNITTDTELFFESRSHQEALASLTYGIEERKGLILITGEVGTGKTTLCKALLERLPKSVRTSFVMSPYFSDIQLLQAIVEDFGLESEKKTRLDIVKKLDDFLIDLSLNQGNAVLIIDEAQNLRARQLEQIRLPLKLAGHILADAEGCGKGSFFPKRKGEQETQIRCDGFRSESSPHIQNPVNDPLIIACGEGLQDSFPFECELANPL